MSTKRNPVSRNVTVVLRRAIQDRIMKLVRAIDLETDTPTCTESARSRLWVLRNDVLTLAKDVDRILEGGKS